MTQSDRYDLSQDEFAAYARTVPMRDVGGSLTEGERSGMSAMGDRWVLMRVDPDSLEPRPGRPRKRRAIIYSALADDVLDGRHRRAAAREEGDQAISAWVGMDQEQYDRWQATGTWTIPAARKTSLKP